MNFSTQTEDQAFVLVFVMKKTEFFTAKHCLSWLQATQKLRSDKKKRKFKFCCMLRIIRKHFFHWATFNNLSYFCLHFLHFNFNSVKKRARLNLLEKSIFYWICSTLLHYCGHANLEMYSQFSLVSSCQDILLAA